MWGHNKRNPSMLQAAIKDEPVIPRAWSTGGTEIKLEDL